MATFNSLVRDSIATICGALLGACSEPEVGDRRSFSRTERGGTAESFSVRNGEIIGATDGLSRYDLVGRILRNGQLKCTGTLIAPDVVMTTAYCVEPGGRGQTSLDSFTFQRDGEPPRVISGKKVHPSYARGGIGQDETGASLALLKILWSYPELLAAVGDPIYDQTNSLTPGTQLETVGYGDTAIDSAHLKRRGLQTLEGYYFYPGDPTEFLSFRIGPSGQVSCNKDGGGPDFIGNKIAAITTYYAPGDATDCLNSKTSIDVSIAPLAAWIRTTANAPFPPLSQGSRGGQGQQSLASASSQRQSDSNAAAAAQAAARAAAATTPGPQPTATPTPVGRDMTTPVPSLTPQGPRLRPTPTPS